MAKQRILNVLGNLNHGGAETMVMNIYRKLDKEKFQMDFIVHTNDIGVYENEILELGGKIYRMPKYNVINHFKYKKAWKTFFKEHKEYKLIHAHVRSTASIFLKIAKQYGLKTISHSHSTSSGKGIRAIVKNILQFRIRYIADYFMGCSKEANKWLFGKKVANGDRCIVLNNAIDVDKYKYDENIRENIRKELGIKDSDIVIGHVGRFVKVKNHKLIINIFEQFNKLEENSKLLLIGNGELMDEIKSLVKAKGLEDSVIFLQERNDINKLLQAMDVFLMPSLYEGLPLTLIEAQAANLKVVISDNITNEVDVTNLVTRISLNESEDKWAKKIREIAHSINRTNEQEIVDRIKENGFDIKDTTDKLSEIYSNLLKEPKIKIMFAIGSMSKCGAQRVIANLSSYLQDKENQISIVATFKNEDTYKLKDGVKVYALDDKEVKNFFIKKNINRIIRLYRIIKEERPNVIVSFLPEPSYRVLFLKLFNRKLKVIVSVRNDPKIEYANVFNRIVMRLLYPFANGFVFQTEEAKDYFPKKIQDKAVIIPNPIAKEFVNANINKSKKDLIVSVGRLEEQKNYELLIRAFAKIASKIPKYKLIIYGDGSQKVKLEGIINSLKLKDRITLYGNTNEVKEKLNEAKIFVLSSKFEGMPNALMEAMAMGLACVSTDCPCGGPAFLIENNVSGLLVKQNSENQLSKAILKLAKNDDLVKSLAIEAVKIREKLSPDNINNSWEEYIMRQINEKNNHK